MTTEKMAVIDFETDPFAPGRLHLECFSCGFFDGKTYQKIWGSDRAVKNWAVEKVRKFGGLVYAHNGGKFDFLGFLFERAGDALYGEIAEMRGGRLVRMKFGDSEIRDSYAILPAPLSSYDKGDIDYRKFEKPVRENHKAEILKYLQRDCESLHALIRSFLDVHGTKPLTAAAAGFAFLKSLGYKIPSMNEGWDRRFRKFYFGGRCEALKPGVHWGRFLDMDIKSAYPAAMREDHALGGNGEYDFIKNPKEVLGSDFVVFSGKSESGFPLRGKKNEPLRFGGGGGIFYVTGWEYNEAKKLKLIRGKVNYVWRVKVVSNFKRYVDHFFAVKEEAEKAGDKAGRLIAKIMLNAVYGKFAQRADAERYRESMFVPSGHEMSDAEARAGWTEDYVDDRSNFAVWSRPSKRPGVRYCVATGASITGKVRAWLMRAIRENDAYYCDTDGLICRDAFVGKCGGLGNWEKKAEGDLLYVAGKKMYALRVLKKYAKDAAHAKESGYFWDGSRGWKVASKGVRLTPEQIRVVAVGGEVTYTSDAPVFSVKQKKHFITRRIKRTK